MVVRDTGVAMVGARPCAAIGARHALDCTSGLAISAFERRSFGTSACAEHVDRMTAARNETESSLSSRRRSRLMLSGEDQTNVRCYPDLSTTSQLLVRSLPIKNESAVGIQIAD